MTNNSDDDNKDLEIAKTTPETLPPKLLTYCVKGSLECMFCHSRQDDTYYLYTRKQIHVCSQCEKALEAIMETNHKVVE